MKLQSGICLVSTTALDQTVFERAVIFIAECNENGALGFIINRPFERALNELTAFKDALPFPLFEGGPVNREGLFFLHSRPDLIEGGKPIGKAVYLGGNFNEAVEAINDRRISQDQVKLFIGYCGWDSGELETEIEEGSWLIKHPDQNILFKYNTHNLWADMSKDE